MKTNSYNIFKYARSHRLLFNRMSARHASSDNFAKILPKNKHLLNGPSLKDFFKDVNLKQVDDVPEEDLIPYLQTSKYGSERKVYFDVYGCQMNVNDTEIIWSILKKHNFTKTNNMHSADVVLIITCSIRDNAELKIWNKIETLKGLKKKKKNMKIGILGCMAERLKHKVLEIEKSVDLVAGPDSYKDLPRMLALTNNNQTAVNVLLSLDETYADIMPLRLNEDSISVYVSIMRGCDNMCTYCIVPFTRGRERSRPLDSILDEVRYLRDQGIKEVTLLGQNVNSYRDVSKSSEAQISNQEKTNLVKGFKTVYKAKMGGLRFADLLSKVAEIDPEIRIRFTSPHPKDFPDEVLQAIRSYPNICKNLHLPAQSGNSNVLDRMRRGYTRDSYIELVDNVKTLIPEVSLSSDFICGFCGETDDEFEDTLTLMDYVKYNVAYLFAYSMREKTTAHRRFVDDIPEIVKKERLVKMSNLFRSLAKIKNEQQIGKLQLVLVEGASKRSNLYYAGRNDGNTKVIFPLSQLGDINGSHLELIKPGDYIAVQINDANSQVLKGIPLFRTSLVDFYKENYLHQESLENVKYSSFL